MKKKIILIIIAIIVPNLAFASWWNPFSWFHRQDVLPVEVSQTQILENKIKDLESKIEKMSASTTQIQIIATTTSPKGISNINKNTKSLVKKIEQDVVETRDYKILYDDLIFKYSYLRDKKLASDIVVTAESEIKDTNNNIHLIYLNKLQGTLNQDLNVIDKRDPSTFDLYNQKYLQVIKDYGVENDRYTKASVVNFLKENQYNLYDTDMHIRAALILDSYDRAFKTKYSNTFKTLHTKQETVEFVNTFLLDAGGY